MDLDLLTSLNLALQPQCCWLWFSEVTSSFIVGDDKRAFAVSVSHPEEAKPLTPAPKFPRDVPIQSAGHVPTIQDYRQQYSHPLNLPIPDLLYDELAQHPWHGFQLLPRCAYEQLPADDPSLFGDLARTLAFGPDYGLYFLHCSSSMVLNLRSGSMQLLQQSSCGFTLLDEARTRGRKAVAFAANPSEPVLVYVDNYGSSFAHEFSSTKFGKARKIDAWEHAGRAIEFANAGRTLVVGGMGHLAAYQFDGKKFSKTHEVSVAVRDLIWVEEQGVLLVNQGMHGLSFYRLDEGRFTPWGTLKQDGPLHRVAASKNLQYLAAIEHNSPKVCVYQRSQR